MDEIMLNEDQEAEAARIEDVVLGAARGDLRRMIRLLVSKENAEFFGETEFLVRDIVLGIAARGIDAALAERKKGGTGDPRWPAPTPSATATPGSTTTGSVR